MKRSERIFYPFNPNRERAFSGTERFLRWFNHYYRNEDLHITTEGTADGACFPTTRVKVFVIMRSSEATHIPVVFELTNSAANYVRWRQRVFDNFELLHKYARETLKEYLRGREVRWSCAEFIGWTADVNCKNPEQAAEAFSIEVDLSASGSGKRN